MAFNLSDLHLLRPAWLLLALIGVLLPMLWRRSRDAARGVGGIVLRSALPAAAIAPVSTGRIPHCVGTMARRSRGALRSWSSSTWACASPVARSGCAATRPCR